jgi:hypothetical protein
MIDMKRDYLKPTVTTSAAKLQAVTATIPASLVVKAG